MSGVFLPIAKRAYIKVTPQQGSQSNGGLDKLSQLAPPLLSSLVKSKFVIDLISEEEATFENVVPENPLEDGSFVNDHITNLPVRLTLQFLITDTPVDTVDPTFGRFDSGFGRAKDEFERLEKIRNDNEPMIIVTGLRVYQNMVVRKLTPRRDRTGHVIYCEGVFSEIQVASSSSVAATSFETLPDSSVEHSFTPGQVLGVVALAAIQLGA